MRINQIKLATVSALTNDKSLTRSWVLGPDARCSGQRESSSNQMVYVLKGSVGASDFGAGHSFVVSFGFHLGFTIFLFPVSTAQIIGEFWNNR
jgi:hypothetical protein